MENEHLTATDLFARYHIGLSTLRRWLGDRSIAFPRPFRIKRRRLWKRAEIEYWERERQSVAV
jgi:predicted DNA-binding transcriptional regulator AlpA